MVILYLPDFPRTGEFISNIEYFSIETDQVIIHAQRRSWNIPACLKHFGLNTSDFPTAILSKKDDANEGRVNLTLVFFSEDINSLVYVMGENRAEEKIKEVLEKLYHQNCYIGKIISKMISIFLFKL